MQPSLKESNFCFVLLTIYMVIFVISLFHASQAVSNKTMRFLIVSLVVMQRFFDPNLSPLIRKLLVLHESLKCLIMKEGEKEEEVEKEKEEEEEEEEEAAAALPWEMESRFVW